MSVISFILLPIFFKHIAFIKMMVARLVLIQPPEGVV